MLNTIYKITNTVNGKVYIGKTSNTIEKRFKEHIKDSKRVRCNKRPLYDAINKYGIENFIIETVESNICDSDINDKEIYYIQKYNSYIGFKNSNGYNATLGGDSKKYKNLNISSIINDYNNGMSLKELGKLYNSDRTHIANLLRANNVHLRSSADARSRSVKQIDADTNNVIATFISSKHASISLVGDMSARHKIDNTARKNQHSALGYVWEFVS